MKKGNYACGIFVNIQKSYNTLDHHILSKKLEYYGVWGIPNKWFTSYLSNKKQWICFLKCCKSSLGDANCGIPQDSIQGPLPYPIYIKWLTWYSEVEHFPDNTNLLNFNDSAKSIIKLGSHDLENLANWLKGNKIAPNFGKMRLHSLLHLRINLTVIWKSN